MNGITSTRRSALNNLIRSMKLHFHSKQEFQLEMVKALTYNFEGQPFEHSIDKEKVAIYQLILDFSKNIKS